MNNPAAERRDIVIPILTIGICLPPLLILFLILRYGVNVPFADDFTVAPLLLSAHNGTLTFSELFAQHNEHRMVLPRLLALGFAHIAHGDLRVQMTFSLILVVGTAVVFWRLIQRTVTTSLRDQLLLMLPVSVLLFSPVQAENWMWGFQVALFLNNLVLVTAVAVAVSATRLVIKFVFCASLAAVATYSFGSGALLWALTFPLALFTPMRRTTRAAWAIAWSLVAATFIGCYFLNYQHPTPNPGSLGPARITSYVGYVLAFLGGHLSSLGGGILGPIIIGCAILVITTLVFADARQVVPPRDIPLRLLPWAAFACYAGFNAALAAMARISFGVTQALDSRYTSFSLYSSIGLLGACAVVVCYEPLPGFRTRRALLVAALIALSISAYSSGIESMRITHQSRLHGKAGLLFANVLDSSAIYETHLRANQADAKRFAQMLDSLGLLRPSLITSARPRELTSVAADKVLSGYFDELRCSGSSCVARGWAFLPGSARTADAVLLSQGAGGAATLFHMTSQMHQRVDVARLLQDSTLLESGWTAKIDRESMPEAMQPVTAWAVDGETATLYELRGSHALP